MEFILTKEHLIKELNNEDFKNVPSLYNNIKSLESNKDILYNANIIIFQSSSINHNQRLVLLNKINNLSRKCGITFCIAHNLTLVIKLNRELGLQKNLVKDSHEAIDMWKTILDDPLGINGLIFSYTDLGLLFSDYNLNLLAIKYLDKANSLISECIENYNPFIKLNIAYAIVYGKIKNNKKSNIHYDKVIKIAESKNDLVTLIPVLTNTANDLIERKKYNQAKDRCQRAIEISKNNNDMIYRPYIYHLLGKIYLNLKKNNKSKKYLDKALELFEKMDAIKMIPKVLYSIGEYSYKNNKYDEAIKTFNNVLLKNKSIKEYDLDIKTLKMISMIYKQLKDDKSLSLIINELNKALEKSIKDKDRIFNDVNINALKYLSKENDFSLMEENNLKIKFDIEAKKRKLTTEALVSFSEREFLKNITTQISRQNLSNNKIIKLCNERMMHTKNWDIFMKLFNDIHTDFNKYIINKSNSITESELRVCNLIKMNFSTLEITEILAITRRGVEQHRYRIKKKLKLKTDLTVFLQSI